MKGYKTTIDVDTKEDYYSFDVEVVDYFVQKPLGKWCDSDVDCYGYTDLDYVVLGGSKYNEETEKMQEISLQEAIEKAEELSDSISEPLRKRWASASESFFRLTLWFRLV